ncbi:MAG: peptidase S16, lon-like protein [Cycloclasticus sp.]|nr:MAG: peptidase S16, lon-like protein [Cycloclasticus sp.]
MRTATDNVPIFPLSMVLFPEGVLSLRVFETRYLDMISRCLKDDVPFGICMITEGSEVGLAASCYQMGTLAKIVNWDQAPDGVLNIEVLGCQRFNILQRDVASNELTTAVIQILDETTLTRIPEELSDLTHMLKRAISKQQPNLLIDDEQFNDANWVSYRLTEILPIENIMRQRLLEIEDPIDRLQMVLGLFTKR